MSARVVVHYDFGGAPFCGNPSKALALSEHEERVTCKLCRHKLGKQEVVG